MKTYNNEFCVIDTPEKAYVLGLIFSDGSIGNYGNSYIASLSQHENEEYLLNSIIDLFPFFYQENIYRYPSSKGINMPTKSIC